MRKRSYLWIIAALTGVLMLTLAGCSADKQSSSQGQEKVLKFITVWPANTMDPHRCHTSFILNSGTTETLIGLDPKTTELYPWLAESWKSDDGQHWEFKIRKGVKFHNGKDVTPEAVKASLERSIAVNPGIKAALKIASIEVAGDVLNIVTELPYPALPSELVHYNAVIIDVTAPEDKPPIGTGAFMFASFDISKEAQLVKFPQYWNGQAKLDKVIMTANDDANARMLALQSGDADVIYRPAIETLPTLRNNDKLVVESMPGKRVYHLIYNYSGQNHDLWANEEFRKGIDALINRQEIVDKVMGKEAIVAYNPFPGNYPFTPELKPHVYSVDEALKHFQAAGLTVQNGKVLRNGQPIKLRMATYIARPELPQIAQIVQSSAKQVGIEMEIHVAENIDEFLPQGNWDLVTYSLLTTTRGDGSFFLNAAFSPKGMQNHGRLHVPELVALIDQYNQIIDKEERNVKAKAIATMIEDRAYNAYIASPYETAAYRKNVKGWVTPSNEFEFQMVTKDLDIVSQ
ncbi:ABC transporter substrate-binding protein|uniref:Peptide/nickel transport system substrate-binding protein n=1 Tax=Dendrosporobacter quercicolus TaxID=146817 RepID=A0A1G9QV16_9FIRM|nr:ABC transporter substrate-binding protein [Dendrosporobacter quercicolus]NSL48375.1 ABC transporter substrate-binding protein [Dendrosporobacter quercicolus DSM 1736]SDM14856.1 peptide/nickel transport system substrate-binding protein [Dendrosporobacter quercicolus]